MFSYTAMILRLFNKNRLKSVRTSVNPVRLSCSCQCVMEGGCCSDSSVLGSAAMCHSWRFGVCDGAMCHLSF